MTRVYTWFERDRAHIEVRSDSGETVWEAWDESVHELFEDGFLVPGDLEASAIDYCQYLGLVTA